MHFSKRSFVVGPLAVALVAACSGTDPTVDELSTVSSPIQGGTNDTTHTFAVGIIISQGNSGQIELCSGALLAPNLVATARHCVASIPSTTVTCPATTFGAVTAPGNVVVTTDADIRTQATRFGVSKIVVPSGANQTAVCGNDLALLILSQNIALPQYVTPVLDPPMSDHTLYTPTVTAIGYGESSPTDTTGMTAGIRRIRQDIALSCIPNDTTFPNCLTQEGGQMTAAEFASGNGTCEGDSGSSAYDEGNFDSGTWVSFGVLSRGSTMGSTCIGGIYTRFDAWSSLIIATANQAATMGGYAPPAWAGADGGSGTTAADAGSTSSTDAGSSSSHDAGGSSHADAGPSSGASGSSSSSSSGGSSRPASVSSSSSGSSTTTVGSGGGKDAGSASSAQDSGASSGAKSSGSGGNSCSCEAVGAHSSNTLPWQAMLASVGLGVFAQRRRRSGLRSRR